MALEHTLKITRHALAEIEPSDATSILVRASQVAQCGEDNPDACTPEEMGNFNNDKACNITLVREGAEDDEIPEFTLTVDELNNCTNFGWICSQQDLEAVWWTAPPEGMKIVVDVKFCEGTVDILWSGCSEFPGQTMAVERVDAKVEGVFWLHEFGHTKHLCHTNKAGCPFNNDAKAVMHSYVQPSNTKLSAEECYQYRDGRK
jgi:hypothetical protein